MYTFFTKCGFVPIYRFCLNLQIFFHFVDKITLRFLLSTEIVKNLQPSLPKHRYTPMCIDACSILSCGIDVALMPHDEIEHASMHIGETLVCSDAWRDWEIS